MGMLSDLNVILSSLMTAFIGMTANMRHMACSDRPSRLARGVPRHPQDSIAKSRWPSFSRVQQSDFRVFPSLGSEGVMIIQWKSDIESQPMERVDEENRRARISSCLDNAEGSWPSGSS